MEREFIFSGYCRQLDQARTVLCEFSESDGLRLLLSADCRYPDCRFLSECPIAAEIAGSQNGGSQG